MASLEAIEDLRTALSSSFKQAIRRVSRGAHRLGKSEDLDHESEDAETERDHDGSPASLSSGCRDVNAERHDAPSLPGASTVGEMPGSISPIEWGTSVAHTPPCVSRSLSLVHPSVRAKMTELWVSVRTRDVCVRPVVVHSPHAVSCCPLSHSVLSCTS